jgi:hypothetical protein
MARIKKTKLLKKPSWLALVLFLMVVAIGLALVWHHHSKKSVSTIPSNNPVANLNPKANTQSSSSSASRASSTPSSSQSTKSSNSPAPSSGAGPATPYGDFVSSHSAGSASMYSVCNTTAGATCYIQLTNGNLTRNLDTQTTDSNGATNWYWNTSSLSPGSWTVTAIATLNGQVKKAADAKPLIVQ